MITRDDFIRKFEMLYSNMGQKILYYTQDKQKSTLIRQVHIVTSGLNVINQPERIKEPALYRNMKFIATFLKPNTFTPMINDHIQLIQRSTDGIKILDEYEIETVIPIVLNGEVVQYTVYQNNQEVSVWTSSTNK